MLFLWNKEVEEKVHLNCRQMSRHKKLSVKSAEGLAAPSCPPLRQSHSPQTSCRNTNTQRNVPFLAWIVPSEKPSLQITWLGEGMRSDWWWVMWRLALHMGQRDIMTLRLPERKNTERNVWVWRSERENERIGARERMCEWETEKGWESAERRGREMTMAVSAEYVSRFLWLFHPAISANFLS